MKKVWVNEEKNADRIIAISDDKIFKVNPRESRIPQVSNDMENDIIPDDTLSIPFSYIKSIQYREGKCYIQVFFGHESEEYLTINDPSRLIEIFRYFKENIPKTRYRFEKHTPLKAGRQPIIAAILISLLFSWIMYLAIQIEMGSKYELSGSGASLSGIVFALASLGVTRVILIFGTLLVIALTSMIFKMSKTPAIHEIYFIR